MNLKTPRERLAIEGEDAGVVTALACVLASFFTSDVLTIGIVGIAAGGTFAIVSYVRRSRSTGDPRSDETAHAAEADTARSDRRMLRSAIAAAAALAVAAAIVGQTAEGGSSAGVSRALWLAAVGVGAVGYLAHRLR